MVDKARENSRTLWDEMAPGWDRYRDFMWQTTRHVAEWLVDHVEPRPGDTILDLAGGPGDNGFLAAERVGQEGKVVVTDFAPEMVAVARRRAADANLGNVEARVLDAEQMDLDDDSVDGIICRWGFMLMLDPERALGECRRVLKEGRRLSLSVWGSPDQNPWATVTGMTVMQLGHQPARDPFGPGGMFSMADLAKVESMLTGAGFHVVATDEMPVTWSQDSFEDAWAFMSEVAGPTASIIKDLSSDEITALQSQLQTNLEPFRDGTGYTIPGVTLNAAAR